MEPILLWSAPRCLSSVFERSVRELKGVKVIFEPHQQAYYNGPEKKSDSSFQMPSEVNPKATFQAADELLLKPYTEYQAVFCKNHAYFIEGNYEAYTTGRFSSFQHTFLIRNPRKAIVSLYHACIRSGFSTPPRFNGFKELYDMFKTVQLVHPNADPIVIDADDLLMDPRGIMQQYCCATGLPFDEGMLTWTPGVVADWATHKHYREWHETAMMSSGFNKPSSTQSHGRSSIADDVSLPKEVHDAVEKALPLYEAMFAVRMNNRVSV